MAVDSADKRFSMMGLCLPFVRMLPVPDGGFTVFGDRMQFLMQYRGIAPSGLPVVVAGDLSLRRRMMVR